MILCLEKKMHMGSNRRRGPMVFTVAIGQTTMHRVLINCRSSMNIFCKQTYDKMCLDDDLKHCKSCIQGSVRYAKELVKVHQTNGQVETRWAQGHTMQMFVVNCFSTYNANANLSLRRVLHRPEISRRLIKWIIELRSNMTYLTILGRRFEDRD